MTNKEASEYNRVLNSFPGQYLYTSVGPEDKELCIHLEKFGYIRIDGPSHNHGFDITITDTGANFIASGGFTAQVEKEEFDRYHTEEVTRQAQEANKIASRANWISLAAIIIAAMALVVSVVTCQNESKKHDASQQDQHLQQSAAPDHSESGHSPKDNKNK